MAQFCTSTELQVGLSCDKGVHTAALLAPWCCVLAWRHVLAQLEKMSVLLGLDWEGGGRHQHGRRQARQLHTLGHRHVRLQTPLHIVQPC